MQSDSIGFRQDGRCFLGNRSLGLGAVRWTTPDAANDNAASRAEEPATAAQTGSDIASLGTEAMFLAADMLEGALLAGANPGEPRVREMFDLAERLMRWGAATAERAAANRRR